MISVLESLNQGLHNALAANPQVILLGEDVLDPYGGAFKVSRGLSTAFPERVWPMPISEAGMLGMANGMALRGLRPVVELMFGDFLTLAADQLINHAARYRWMYNEQVHVPVLVRTPMGGRRGYGPTHSQTLEKHFIGVPGLTVLAPAAFGDPGQLLCDAILNANDPVLFIENKLLYLQKLPGPDFASEFELDRLDESPAPTYRLRMRGAPAAQLSIVTYGYMCDLARQAMHELAYEDEIFVEIICPTRLSPVDWSPIQASLHTTRQILTVEEGSLTLGWGAEILARAASDATLNLQSAGRVAARDLPIPASGPLEQAVLPQVADILAAVRSLVKG